MSAQHHGPQPKAQKAAIESMLARGRPTREIAAATGRSLNYVRSLQNLTSAVRTDEPLHADHEKHLALIFAARANGFGLLNTAKYRRAK